ARRRPGRRRRAARSPAAARRGRPTRSWGHAVLPSRHVIRPYPPPRGAHRGPAQSRSPAVPQSRSPAVPQSRSPAVPQSIVGGGTDRAVPHRPCPGYGGAAAPHSAASSASPAALVLTGAVLLARAEQFVGQRREVVQRGLLGPVRPLPAPPGRRSLGGLHLRQLTRAVDGARGRLG